MPSPEPQVQKERAAPSRFAPWEESVIRTLASAGLSMVSLGFAAFTFLYSTLLGLRDADERVKQLRTKLRKALYGMALAVLLAGSLVILAFVAIGLDSPSLGFVSILMALSVLCVLCSVTIYIASDVYREREG